MRSHQCAQAWVVYCMAACCQFRQPDCLVENWSSCGKIVCPCRVSFLLQGPWRQLWFSSTRQMCWAARGPRTPKQGPQVLGAPPAPWLPCSQLWTVPIQVSLPCNPRMQHVRHLFTMSGATAAAAYLAVRFCPTVHQVKHESC